MYEIGQFLAEFEYDASMNAVITCLSTISIKTPAASNSTTKPMSPACAVWRKRSASAWSISKKGKNIRAQHIDLFETQCNHLILFKRWCRSKPICFIVGSKGDRNIFQMEVDFRVKWRIIFRHTLGTLHPLIWQAGLERIPREKRVPIIQHAGSSRHICVKGCILETNLEGQGWQTTCLPLCWF